MSTKSGFAALLTSGFLIALMGIAARWFAEYFGESTILQVALAPLGAATVCLTGWMIFRKESFQLDWSKLNTGAFLAFSLTRAISVVFFALSANHIKASNSVFYLYLTSFTTTLVVGTLFFKEHVTIPRIVALCLAVGALAAFTFPIEQAFSWGVAFGMIAGLSDGTYFSSQRYLEGIKLNPLFFYSLLISVAALVLVGAAGGQTMPQHIDIAFLGGIAVAGVLYLIVLQTAFYGFNHFNLNLATIILSSEIFFAIVWNMIVLKEFPTPLELTGSLLLFVGIAIAYATSK